MTDKITLNDGTEVSIKPRITLKTLRDFQAKDELPKSLLQAFVGAEDKPEIMEPYLMNAAWLAYINANKDDHMTKDEFESKIDLDLELLGAILAQMVGGTAKADAKLAQSFKRATKKSKGKTGRKRKAQK